MKKLVNLSDGMQIEVGDSFKPDMSGSSPFADDVIAIDQPMVLPFPIDFLFRRQLGTHTHTHTHTN